MPCRLIALTPEARAALNEDQLIIERFPFRMGRESRTTLGKLTSIVDRRRQGSSRPTNDLYIADVGEFFNLSREHVMIEAEGQEFFVTDLGSVCGTIVEGKVLGGNRAGGRTQLHDHDVIILGTASSPFAFKFRTS